VGQDGPRIFKVPESAGHPDHVDESVLHWDLDLRAASATTYQGMLFLLEAETRSSLVAWLEGADRPGAR
jgi:hypothetical protein